jgi:transcription elongation GreA/GreB family factor
MVRDTSAIYLTEEGAEKLKLKLERLEKSVPELVTEAARTAAFGDRSENAEYQAAKGQLRRTYRQIYSIKDQLKRVEIIKVDPKKAAVQLGSTVMLTTDNKQLTFKIVGPQETNPAKGRISFQSPLGATLMGKVKGEEIFIQTPTGEKKYLIVEIG